MPTSENLGMGADQRARKERRHVIYTRVCGSAMTICLLMVVGLILLLAGKGVSYFWPSDLQQLTLEDGSKVWGEFQERKQVLTGNRDDEERYQVKYKVANRDVYDLDFRWVDEDKIVSTSEPEDLLRLERQEYGVFIGRLKELHLGGEVVRGSASDLLPTLEKAVSTKQELRGKIHAIESGELDGVNARMREIALAIRRVEMGSAPDPEKEKQETQLQSDLDSLQKRSEKLAREVMDMTEEGRKDQVVMVTAEDRTRSLAIMDVLRVETPNEMSILAKTGALIRNLWDFVWDDPRESNTEGGIFPAIFGTILMVFLMTFFVTPFGVLAAVYLREYAKEGPLVRAVRIAIFNLAGVPSIVFGVFGLGFFVYLIGGSIDQLFYPEALPTPTYGTGGILWASLTLALLTVPVVIVATEEALSAVPKDVRRGSYALGATRFETLWRIILPASLPGIMTGVILAIARAAGEVAPLMIVGMVKLAPVPVDGEFPFLHLDRKFMHLGFHIYDLGFQSPNVEATKPLVYATAFLLVFIVLVMNLVAIYYRNRLRERYASSSV